MWIWVVWSIAPVGKASGSLLLYFPVVFIIVQLGQNSWSPLFPTSVFPGSFSVTNLRVSVFSRSHSLPPPFRENLPSRFKFKEYCPMVFRNLRERFGIDDQDYQVTDSSPAPKTFGSSGIRNRRALFVLLWQNSLTRSAPLNSDSQGRFGNRFLCSYDHRFVIKTISSEDIAEMHSILKKYHQVTA